METAPEITGPINLGNPNEFTVLELAETVRDLTSSKSDIVFRDLPQDDPTRRRPDISQAKTVLGWEPKIQIKDGVLRTIAYFEKLI
jgi:UDP-glucuronate decarboxylase